MITVMIYGIITVKFGIKSDTKIEKEHIPKLISEIDETYLASVNFNANTITSKLKMNFSAVVVIVPQDKKEDAIQAAHQAGATGVTHFNAYGMGLSEMDNIYRISPEANDEVLLFILPESLVNKVLESIIHSLHITSTGDGIAFAMPISHMKGISLRQEVTFEEEISNLKKK